MQTSRFANELRVRAASAAAITISLLFLACGASGPGDTAAEDTPGEPAGGAGQASTGHAGAGQVNAAGQGGAGGHANAAGQSGAGGQANTAGQTGVGGAAGHGMGGASVACGGANAGATGWTNVTPSLGAMFDPWSVTADPVRPSDIYVGTFSGSGIIKSSDCGLTWTKINTGAGAAMMDTHPLAIRVDSNPMRDPATPPTMYAVAYFAGGLWKSTDGAVSWHSIWNHNIYSESGADISADVGVDVSTVLQPDPADIDHALVYMHARSTSGISGIFETKDGGGKWVLHESKSFSFEPHNSIVATLSPSIWMVFPGSVSNDMHMYRSTNSGVDWTDAGLAPARGMGARVTFSGGTIYSGADFNSGVSKSTDKGLTWQLIPNTGGATTWVLASATKVYTFTGRYDDVNPPHFEHAELTSDTKWTSEKAPDTMTANGTGAAILFDGTRYVIIAAQRAAGLWRYVEP